MPEDDTQPSPVEEQESSDPQVDSEAEPAAQTVEAEKEQGWLHPGDEGYPYEQVEPHFVVEDENFWYIYHRGAHAASMNTNFPVYDGWIEVRGGLARIPKDRPDWAQRLLRFENFAWCHGPEEAPESFLRAIGA